MKCVPIRSVLTRAKLSAGADDTAIGLAQAARESGCDATTVLGTADFRRYPRSATYGHCSSESKVRFATPPVSSKPTNVTDPHEETA
ncbi:hypothetical protein BaRGS_00023511 [Batillaria attramentaria]|uniref:Universal stress protein n=1 Tax=Batillaria attramentaria TaxID=370345 RepID=A0ABD0KDP7_9CAEN